MQPPPVPSDEQQEQEEIFRLRAQKFKDKEKTLADEREKLEREKSTLIRELKRSQDQLRSKVPSMWMVSYVQRGRERARGRERGENVCVCNAFAPIW